MNATNHAKVKAAICCAFGAAALGALCTTAQATEPELASKTVRFADLNLETPDGAKVLYHRIRAAAREVCEQSVSRDPIMTEAVHGCIDKAIDNAVKKVNAPYLTALRFGNSDVRLASK
jgi:UrcA family protein